MKALVADLERRGFTPAEIVEPDGRLYVNDLLRVELLPAGS